MHDKTVAELSRLLRQKEISSEELTQAYLQRISRFDRQLNAFITVCDEQAVQQARSADRLIAGSDAGPLAGIPLAHKDIFCTHGIKTSCGSRMLDSFVAPYDAHVVSRLKAAGIEPVAMRAFTLDVTIGKKAAAGAAVVLLYGLFRDETLAIQG